MSPPHQQGDSADSTNGRRLLAERRKTCEGSCLSWALVLTSLVAAVPVASATTEPPPTTEEEAPPSTVETPPTTESTEAPTTEPSVTTTEAPVVSTEPAPTTEAIEAPTPSVASSRCGDDARHGAHGDTDNRGPVGPPRPPQTTVIPTADLAASLVATEAIGPGQDLGRVSLDDGVWPRRLVHRPHQHRQPRRPHHLRVQRGVAYHGASRPERVAVGYNIDQNPEDVTWSVGIGGFNQTPTIVDRGTFADCGGVSDPVFVAGGHVGCNGRLSGLIEYRGPGSSGSRFDLAVGRLRCAGALLSTTTCRTPIPEMLAYSVPRSAGPVRQHHLLPQRNGDLRWRCDGDAIPPPGLHRLQCAAASCAAVVDGHTGDVGSGRAGLAGPDVDGRGCDHRLHHPALAERNHGMGDDQRRVQHGHRVHGHRPDQRDPVLLPGARQEPVAIGLRPTSPTPFHGRCRRRRGR